MDRPITFSTDFNIDDIDLSVLDELDFLPIFTDSQEGDSTEIEVCEVSSSNNCRESSIDKTVRHRRKGKSHSPSSDIPVYKKKHICADNSKLYHIRKHFITYL